MGYVHVYTCVGTSEVTISHCPRTRNSITYLLLDIEQKAHNIVN